MLGSSCVLHSIIVIVFAFNPDISAVVSEALDYKDTRFLRSTGIVAGYDMAGLISIIGLFIFAFKQANNKTDFLLALVLLLSCLLSSRVSMVIGTAIFAYMALKITKSSNLGFFAKTSMFSIGFSISLIAVFIAFNAVLISLGFESFFEKESFDKVYAMGTADSLKDMYFLPPNDIALIFGLGVKPGSDVGYVREFYKYGILGFFIVVSIYIFIFITSLKFLKNEKESVLIILFLLILTFILSFKNNYFLTRVSLPSLWLLYSSITYSYKNRGYG